MCRLTGPSHLLGEALHSDGSGGICQKLQFVEIFLGLSLVLLLGDESYQHRSLGLGFRYYKFFHFRLQRYK